SSAAEIAVTYSSRILPMSGRIGEFNMDGSPINATLVNGLDYPWGIASEGNNLYVANGHFVGEYATSGATINDAAVLAHGFPRVMALDGNGFLYTLDDFGTVGKYTTTGATINAELITGLPGCGFPSIATDGQYLYVGDSYRSTVWKFTLTGSLVTSTLITFQG